VAEGIETGDELKAVTDAGVQYGQGYFFAKPAYPPPLLDRASGRFQHG
jgi:EAL domain-containing protein (putative c-di-GMP-specific phosphodiesterase class I)